MELGVVTFLPWIILHLLPSSEAVTCSEIAQCEYDYEEYAKAQARDDVRTLCSLLGNSVECMEVAMNDCQKHSNFPDKKLQQAQEVLEKHKKQVLSFCPHLDNSIVGNSGTDNPGMSSSLRKQDDVGVNDIPANPSCAEIMNCGLDMEQFKVAIRESRLTEACRLIKPSVRCLRLAISDCRETRLFDKEDIANATRSVADAQALFENHCGYSDEKDNIKAPQSEEISNGKLKGQERNPSVDTKKTAEQLDGAKTNVANNYETAHENKISSAKKINDDSNHTKHNRGNAASVQILSLGFTIILLLLST